MLLTKWLLTVQQATSAPTLTGGPLYMYGSNTYGALGDNTTGDEADPQQLGSLSWNQLSVGNGFTVALRSDGKLFTWGLNSVGQLGNNDTTLANKSSPVQLGTSNWTSVSTKESTAYAIRSDGRLFGWGNNFDGQLGQNSILTLSRNYSWSQLATGLSHVLGIRSDGTLWAWGGNTNGELGLGDLVARSSAVQVGTDSWTNIAAGIHSLAIDVTGVLYAWGLNTVGVLGISTTTARSSPTQLGDGFWSQVYASSSNSVALDSNGAPWVWGASTGFQIGDGLNTNRSSPVQVTSISTEAQQTAYANIYGIPLNTSWTSLSVGTAHAAGIQSDGSLWLWGDNTAGQIGDGTTVNRSSPTPINAGTSFTQVAVGSSFSLAIDSDYILYTWGLNSVGQLGDGTLANKSTPAAIGVTNVDGYYGSTGTNLYVAAAGSSLTLSGDFTIELWVYHTSRSGYQQVVDRLANYDSFKYYGSSNWYFARTPTVTYRFTGTNTAVPLNQWTHIAWVRSGSIITMYVSGSSVGTITFGSSINYGSTFYIGGGGSGGSAATERFQGYISNLRIVNGIAVYTGNFTVPTSPLRATQSADTNISAITGTETSLLTCQDITYIDNSTYNETITVNSPSATTIFNPFGLNPLTITQYTNIAAGASHALAVTTANNLYSWGLNTAGQLGDGTTISKSSPNPVGTVTGDGYFSVYFAGQQYFRTNTTSPQRILTSQYTFEAWVYITGNNSGNNLAVFGRNQNSTGTNSNRFFVYITSTTYKVVLAINNDNPGNVLLTSATSLSFRTWTHIAVTRTTSNLTSIWINGQLDASTTNATNFAAAENYVVGALPIISSSSRFTFDPWMIGYISNLRLIIGYAYYISNFTVSTIPLTAISNTVLLLCQSSTLKDNSGNNYALTNSGTTISGNQPFPPTGVQLWNVVSAGASHSVALQADNTVYAWGLNTSGQLGNSSVISRSAPVQITSLNTPAQISAYATLTGQSQFSWTQVAYGSSFALAINTTGKLYAWGLNNAGQLGDSTLINKSSPTPIGTSSYSIISAGASTAAAITVDGKLFVWGLNNAGQVGTTDIISRSSPTQIGISSWTTVSVGGSFVEAITSTGLLFAWGLNTGGQLGLSVVTNRSSPTQVGTSSWTSVSAGAAHTVATEIDGSLWTWGLGTSGQIGDGSVVTKSSPVQITSLSTPAQVNAYATLTGQSQYSFTQVSYGTSFALAIDTSGRLYAWGLNNAGQLGTGDTVNKSSPTPIGTGRSYSQISAGGSFAMALDTTSTLWTWGLNSLGQLGDGTIINKSSPTQIGSSSWSQISAGQTHALGVTSTGSLLAWGLNTSGQLGDNTAATKSSPTQIGTSSWTSVSAGNNNSIGIEIDGSLWTWGLGTSGQVGDGSVVTKSSPVQLTSLSTPAQVNAYATLTGQSQYSFTQVSYGTSFALAIDTVGRLYAWGLNNAGQLGTGDTVNRSSPSPIGAGRSWNQISAGESFAMALDTTNTLWTWGLNSLGQLGDGTIINKSSPTQIGSSSWSQISAGQSHALALTSTNSLYAWGLGTSGQIGDGTALSRSSPTQIGTSSWTSVSAGGSHSIAIRSDSGLFTWGSNSIGQLGNSLSSGNRSSPIQIGTSSWSSIAAGGVHSAALTSDRLLFTWGSGNNGQLGNNLSANRSSPIQIGTSSWTLLKAGGEFCAGLISGTLYAWGLNLNFTQLGTNDSANRSSPTQIGSSSWSAIGAGSASTQNNAAITTGQLYTWGNNISGQLGNLKTLGTLSSLSSPTFVPTITDSWASVAAGGTHSVALRSDRLLFTWGLGTSGQLGNLTILSRSNPIQIGSSSWTQIKSGDAFAEATISGILYTWGLGTSGQLGLDVITSRSSPTQVGASSWSAIGAGAATAVNNAGIASGQLYTWGDNNIGQLGNLKSVGTLSSPTFVPTITDSWSLVAAGGTHTVATRSDRLLFTWGLGTSGQLGNLTILSRSNPVQIGGSSWTQIKAGDAFTDAIISGTLFTWGLGTSGQLGLDVITSRSSPTQVGASSWSAIGEGGTSSLNNAGITTGQLYTWGDNNFGQLGLIYAISGTSSPTLVSTIIDSWTLISAGGTHSVAIRSDKLLFTWGLGTSGQLGSNAVASRSAPLQIGSSSWSTISAGDAMTMATINGTLYTWGLGTSGQLGNDVITSRSSPVQIGTSSWSAIAANSSTAGAIASYRLFMWGTGNTGQLGRIQLLATSSPAFVKSVTDSFTIINTGTGTTAGTGHTLAIRSDNILWSWGINNVGQLGTLDVLTRSLPTSIGSTSWTTISAGNEYSLGINSSTKSLYAWGNNTAGALGTFDTVHRSSPVQITSLTNATTEVQYAQTTGITTYSWIVVSSNGGSTLAIRNDNTLWAWGDNINSELGLNDAAYRSSPVQVGTSSWINVVAAPAHTMALRSDNLLFTWGYNTEGELGLNNTIHRSSPTQVGSSSFTAISAGLYYTGAIDINGKLYVWGYNTYGNLGLNDLVHRSSPVQLGSDTNWSSISAGGTFQTFAIKTTGALFAFGSNATDVAPGQLGLNSIVSRSSPTQVGTSSWSSVSAGRSFSLGVTSDGLLYSWGVGLTGQLGISTLANRSSPTQIGTSSWTNVSAGWDHSVAIDLTSRLFTWGDNASGQLGIGDAISRSSPTQVGASSWSQVSAGFSNTFGLSISKGLYAWGNNSNGNLGVNNRLSGYNTPYYLSYLGYDSWTAIAATNTSTNRTAGAIRLDGRLFTWGPTTVGKLGTEVQTANRSFPTQIGSSSWTSVSVGGSFMFGSISNTLYAWGDDTIGQLGITNAGNAGVSTASWLISRSSPVQLGADYFSVSPIQIGSSSWSQISSGTRHVLGLLNNKLYAWGYNATAQLGTGDIINRSSPVQIGTSSWNQVSAGDSHSVGIDVNQQLYAWGAMFGGSGNYLS